MSETLSIEEQILAEIQELEAIEAIEQAKYLPTASVPLKENPDYQNYRKEAQKKKRAAQSKRAYARKKAELLATGYDPKLFDKRIKRVAVKRLTIAGKEKNFSEIA